MQSELIISPGRVEKNYWGDLWRYRELFWFLAWRDILVRYKQAAIGVGWALLRPLVTMLVLTAVFSRVAKLAAPGGVPYALLVMAAMLPWQFVATAVSESSQSLIGNGNLISKIYFPRLIIPTGAVLTNLVDLLISLGLMGALMLWEGFSPDWRLCALPAFAVLGVACALGAGLWLSALNVQYRDFRYVVPFIVQCGLYVSPVGFSSGVIPPRWRLLYELNPMAGVIEGFRWCLLRGETALDWTGVAMACGVTGALLGSGLWYFRRMERTFADVI
ncbi:MAG TPA: ABC transporter permease [Verrucomicrobiae bacterium]|nr:ABC transporter permease [Verrucomicrobiae bacterium]